MAGASAPQSKGFYDRASKYTTYLSEVDPKMEPKDHAASPARPGAAALAKKPAGTSTETQVEAAAKEDAPVLTLRLEPRRHVRWDNGVVDNEHMHKRSSKRCCIFKKRRAFGESSSESSEDENDENGRRGPRIAQPKHPPGNPLQAYHA